MPRNVRTARGDVVDFDALTVKHQLAQAPMNIDVARRKEFIDNKEGRARGQRAAGSQATTTVEQEIAPIEVEPKPTASPADFELEAEPAPKKK